MTFLFISRVGDWAKRAKKASEKTLTAKGNDVDGKRVCCNLLAGHGKILSFKGSSFFCSYPASAWLVLYGISMSSNINIFFPSGSNPSGVVSVNYMTFMAAGVVGMTILFTCLYAGQNVQFDKQYGLMKLIVVSPMPRSQILLGVTLGGITKALIQTTIVIAFGYVLGVISSGA